MHDAAAAKSAVSLVHKPPLKHVLQQELQNTLLLVEPHKIFLSCILNQSEFTSVLLRQGFARLPIGD